LINGRIVIGGTDFFRRMIEKLHCEVYAERVCVQSVQVLSRRAFHSQPWLISHATVSRWQFLRFVPAECVPSASAILPFIFLLEVRR
jgi:hypothetical protein